ncbi:hypothetical protein [Hydrotalea sandarakina]|jgi:hypothetical protein|uniref:Lipoprotein n=1 Tax=Hydrotalea sandarakina TaxID=1004304 RepID=A0A2W7RK87_9BACT|nr:hypothetical protein [Hydrotalea sandarakina]PZX59416.1 hypothetical protein LX80_02841 [Hydrotalea sandarakina]
MLLKKIHSSIVIIISIASMSCNQSNIISISVQNVDSIFYNLKLGNGETTAFQLKILSNTTDDTTQLDTYKIPPNYTGNLIYIHDYYNKNINLTFKSYKAKKGQIKLEYNY